MSFQSTTECVVSGALACVLRVSRVAGIAPLQFRRVRSGWCTRSSFPASVYGEILTITLSLLALFCFITDFIVLGGPPVVGTVARQTVYFVDVTIMALLVLTNSFTGTKRMKNMVVYLNQIYKINYELTRYNRAPNTEKERWFLFVLSMIGGTFTVVLDYGVFVYMTISHHGRVVLSACYLFYYLLYIELMIIQTQFAMIVLAALTPLKQLNNCLKYLLQEITSKANTKTFPQQKPKMNNYILPDVTNTPRKPSRDAHEVVRHLAVLHGCVCDVVRLIDKSHGPILLILLLSYLLHLVVALYFLFKFFLIDSGIFVFNVVIQSIWGIFHISSLITVVEPCHRTQEEMANTREIVSRMTQTTLSPDDPLSVELEIFYRHLTLNQVTYSPLKMFTINRSLVITMLSAITTYLVVVIQIKEPKE